MEIELHENRWRPQHNKSAKVTAFCCVTRPPWLGDLDTDRSGFSIFIDTVFQGPVPSVTESLPTDPWFNG